MDHGFCDFFLLPNLTLYPTRHSYILELKYLPNHDFEEKSAAQREEVVRQIEGYAKVPHVEALRQGTQLHKIILKFCGWELVRIKRVD